jgi:alpha-tubulin suppressor-like RCC1 family protein
MFSWGVAINGELGQGGLEDAYISAPAPVPFTSVEVTNGGGGGGFIGTV